MGFWDAVTGGKRELKKPAADRLFAMTTAYIRLETGLGVTHKNAAGIVFQAVQTADFARMVADAEELLRGAADDTDTQVETHDDEYGYRWIVLRDPDFEDLVVSINTISTELEGGGYGDRLLAAVFAFEDKGKPLYFIYNYKRGSFYPFVPAPGEQARDTERELRLKAQLGGELPIEPEIERWFPLWEIPL